jgi:hypothetical protein
MTNQKTNTMTLNQIKKDLEAELWSATSGNSIFSRMKGKNIDVCEYFYYKPV